MTIHLGQAKYKINKQTRIISGCEILVFMRSQTGQYAQHFLVQLRRNICNWVSSLLALKLSRKLEKENRGDKNSLKFSHICYHCFLKSVVVKIKVQGKR